jgi:uncharacterized protein
MTHLVESTTSLSDVSDPINSTNATNSMNLIIALKKYFEKRPEVVATYLFGSYARGLEKQSSDIDLGILLDHEAMSDENELRKTYSVGLGLLLLKDFHLVIMNNAGEGILSQIFKHGKCVFKRKPKILSRFKTIRYAMIAEFGHHRNLVQMGFVSRILEGRDDR